MNTWAFGNNFVTYFSWRFPDSSLGKERLKGPIFYDYKLQFDPFLAGVNIIPDEK